MSATQKVMGHVYAIFTILVWGSCFVLTKQMLTAYTAIQIIPLRMGLAYITLRALRPKTLKLPRRDELMFILIGITGGSFYFFLQNSAAAPTSAANVSILVSLSPILTVILAQLYSRSGERLGKFVYIGAVVALAGVVLVVLNGAFVLKLSPLGDLLSLLAAGSWACYSVLIKRLPGHMDGILLARRVMLYGVVTAVPLLAARGELASPLAPLAQPKMLFCILFLAVLGSAVCFAIWNTVISRLGVVRANNYIYLQPFITIVASHFLLG